MKNGNRRESIRIKQNKRKRKLKRKLTMYAIGLIAYIGLCFVIALSNSKANVETFVYVVEPGDTLWSIARETYGNKVDIRDKTDLIREINGLYETADIYGGQALELPVK